MKYIDTMDYIRSEGTRLAISASKAEFIPYGGRREQRQTLRLSHTANGLAVRSENQITRMIACDAAAADLLRKVAEAAPDGVVGVPEDVAVMLLLRVTGADVDNIRWHTLSDRVAGAVERALADRTAPRIERASCNVSTLYERCV